MNHMCGGRCFNVEMQLNTKSFGSQGWVPRYFGLIIGQVWELCISLHLRISLGVDSKCIGKSIHNVYDVIVEDTWDEDRLLEILPQDLALHVIENITPPTQHNDLDRPYWMLEPRGNFSVKSAWEYLRRRRNSSIAYKNMRVKGLPFKIALFMWKVWKGKLPLDDYFRRLGYFMPSRCWCCINPEEETMSHVFFRSYAAHSVWYYFLSNVGIAMEGLSLQQAVVKCWTIQVILGLKPIFQALPSIILWEL